MGSLKVKLRNCGRLNFFVFFFFFFFVNFFFFFFFFFLICKKNVSFEVCKC